MKPYQQIYSDGAIVRVENKKIAFKQIKDSICILFMYADCEPDKPAVAHECIRGKVRRTDLKISVEGMDLLVNSYMKYRLEQLKNK